MVVNPLKITQRVATTGTTMTSPRRKFFSSQFMGSKIPPVPIDPASEAFYDAHASRVYALALRVTGDRDVAAEVVEELFVGIRNGTLVHDRGSLDAWLIRTARDIALEHREGQTAAAAVQSTEATPRAL